MATQPNQPLAHVQDVTQNLGNVTAVAVTPNGQFAYAVNFGNPSQITPFSVDVATGQLTAIPVKSPIQSGYQSSYAAIDGLGRFLFVANSGNNQADARNVVESFRIEADGTLTQAGSSPQLPSCPVGMTVDINDNYLYVLCYNAASDGSPAFIASYEIQLDGTLSAVGSVNIGSFGAAIAQSADGGFLFAVTFAPDPNKRGQIAVYPLNQGTVGASPVAQGRTNTNLPNSIAVTAANVVYVGEDPSVSGHNPHLINSQAISAFAFAGASQTLTALPPVQPAQAVTGLAVDASGSYLVVTGDGSVWAYPIKRDGTLDAASATLPAGAEFANPVIAPSTRFVYVADYSPAALHVYSLAAPALQGGLQQALAGTTLTLSFTFKSGAAIPSFTACGFELVTAAASRFPVYSTVASSSGTAFTTQVQLPLADLPAGCLVRPFVSAPNGNKYVGPVQPFNYGPPLFMASAGVLYDGSYRKLEFRGAMQPGQSLSDITFQWSKSADMQNPTTVVAAFDGTALTARVDLAAPKSATTYYARVVANGGAIASSVVTFADAPDVSIAVTPGQASVSYQVTVNPIVTEIALVGVAYTQGSPDPWHGFNVSPPYKGTVNQLTSGARYEFRAEIKRVGYPTIRSIGIYVTPA
ncbi:MAG: beta-propeller fold lactonase family protein [Betaproteobacteria bacterium]|nr:beta-propeller fold lactonase family protein [Betaproteobacteria bacterium]